jgi:DNA gyrase subunit A
MEQDFSMRYPLIDGQGNFGSVDDDPPAAMRYTEIRMARIAEEMLADIDKETVDFLPNYDGSLAEPVVLPNKTPNLLINGSSGIAVGMATNIPPHNLGEIVDACIYLMQHPQAGFAELMQFVPGPDFPTAGFIYGRAGIVAAYRDGRGIIQLRARASIEPISRERKAIIITEIPFQVNKAKLIERIAELVREKKIEGISDLRDESDREGMRIVIELRKDEEPQVILNNLFKMTPMQTSFGVIMLAIVNNQPKVLPLAEALRCFTEHRKDVVRRRTLYDLAKAEARAHILEGLQRALDHLDAVIQLIRSSKEASEARQRLMQEFSFTAPQAQAILEMRLQRLTGLERDKILQELGDTQKLIAELRNILGSETELERVIIDELRSIKETYGDQRRTEIVEEEAEIHLEDLIADEQVVITMTYSGYIKRTAADVYRSQGRGGKGRIGMTTREEDFISHVFVASTHSYLLIFTNKGRVHWLKVYEIPDVGAAGRGKAIVNLVRLENDEKMAAIMPVREFEPGHFAVMTTRKGIIKKTEMTAFANPRAGGLIAIVCDEGDELIQVQQTDGMQDVLLATSDGKAIRFGEGAVRDMGRQARGVRGITLREGDLVVAMETFRHGGTLLAVTEHGFGKRTSTEQYRRQARGGQGVISIKTTPRNGKVINVCHVTDSSQVIMVTEQGKIIRLDAVAITETAMRGAQGVKLIDLHEEDRVAAVTVFEEEDEKDISSEA